MSVPSMEELVEMFIDGDGLQDVKSGLRAVLDRLKPVVAKSYKDGRYDAHERTMSNPKLNARDEYEYATRIIDQIKGA